MERFIGVLIEHYGGAFPLWLAPVQAVITPISEHQLEYATQVRDRLRSPLRHVFTVALSPPWPRKCRVGENSPSL